MSKSILQHLQENEENESSDDEDFRLRAGYKMMQNFNTHYV